MRMLHYFLAGVLLLVPALGWTVLTGLAHDGSDRHLWAGLFTAVLAIGVHTLVILFMLVTGRVLREAMLARPLGPDLLARQNEFFARRRAYPLAVLGAFSIVAAGVLGWSQRGFGLPPAWHMLAGIAAVLANLWALQQEHRALRENQRLVDEAARRLDALDRERERQGLPGLPDEPRDARSLARWGLVVASSAWLPYFYWALIPWRGDFSKVSVHPWLEGSLFGLAVFLLARRERRRVAR